MIGSDLALWAALAGLAALLLDRRRTSSPGSGGLTVTGGSVEIDASNAVERTTVWQYLGATRTFVWTRPGGNARASGDQETFSLETGAYYEQVISYDVARSYLSTNMGAVDAASWTAMWLPVLATVQEQLEMPVRKVPNNLKS